MPILERLNLLVIDENHELRDAGYDWELDTQDKIEEALITALKAAANSPRVSADVAIAIRREGLINTELTDIVGLAWDPEFPRPGEFATALDNANFFGYLENVQRRDSLAPLTLTVEIGRAHV